MNGPASLVSQTFVNLTDPRMDRGHNHDLLEMIFITLTATICGANGWADVERFAKAKRDWFERYLKLEEGIPSHDTLGRVFAKLDTGQFLTAMHAWVDRFAGSLRDRGIAIDGKVLRGSFDRAADQDPLHTITAFATDTRLVLRQMSVDDKSNEIPAVPKLLELFIEYGEANYEAQGLRHHATVEKSHGRQERRDYYTIAVPDEAIFADWKGIKTIGMVYRHREGGVAEHDENTFFISSLPPKVKRLSRLSRDHWKIENSQHYVLDVTFAEDASRIRVGNSPEISAAFRRMALNILQQDTTVKDAIRGKRLRAGWDDNVLDNIYAGFNSV